MLFKNIDAELFELIPSRVRRQVRLLHCDLVDIISISRCASTEPWSSVEVPSSSEEDKSYLVVRPWLDDEPKDLVCECPGYIYKGSCKHQDIAATMFCDWDQKTGPEKQNLEQRRNGICPRCKKETVQNIEAA